MATLPWEQPGFMHPMDFKKKKYIYIYKSINPVGLKHNITLNGAGRVLKQPLFQDLLAPNSGCDTAGFPFPFSGESGNFYPLCV